MSGLYYALSVAAQDPTLSHYISITPVPPLEFMQGGFTIGPAQAAAVSVTIYPQVVQVQAPPSLYIGGSVTVVTDSPVVAGQLLVSPASTFPVTITCYGVGGKELGSQTLPAGQETVPFSFKVTPAEAIPSNQREDVLKAAAPKQS